MIEQSRRGQQPTNTRRTRKGDMHVGQKEDRESERVMTCGTCGAGVAAAHAVRTARHSSHTEVVESVVTRLHSAHTRTGGSESGGTCGHSHMRAARCTKRRRANKKRPHRNSRSWESGHHAGVQGCFGFHDAYSPCVLEFQQALNEREHGWRIRGRKRRPVDAGNCVTDVSRRAISGGVVRQSVTLRGHPVE